MLQLHLRRLVSFCFIKSGEIIAGGIREASIIGEGIGLALRGFRPINTIVLELGELEINLNKIIPINGTKKYANSL